MSEFWIEISFMNKSKETKVVKNTDKLTALTYALNSLSLVEKDNVIGVKITHVNE